MNESLFFVLFINITDIEFQSLCLVAKSVNNRWVGGYLDNEGMTRFVFGNNAIFLRLGNTVLQCGFKNINYQKEQESN